MSEAKSVSQVLSEYQSALEKLESKDPKPTSDAALAVLLIRDELQDILSHRTNLLSAPHAEIEQLDGRLQRQQKLILKLIRISDWRSRLEPSEKNWWWFFASNWEKWDWLWNGLTIVALTVSLSLVVNTSSKILSGGASSETTLAVFGQAVLTLMAGGGAFTEGGRKAIDKILISINIPEEFWQELSCGFSWMLMLSLLGVNSYLPTWAIDVNKSGIENFKNGRIESAKGDFEQAIAMRPDYADAYYNLGWLYEEINDLEKAKAQYELAVQIDSEKFIDSTNYLKAINNLGRLYILKKEYGTALRFLNQGTEIATKNAQENANVKQVYYSLLKNTGWARFMQERYDESESKLRLAIKLDPERSSSYCLLAQVVDAKNPKEPAKASNFWTKCVSNVTPTDLAQPEDDEWYGLANKRLNTVLTAKDSKDSTNKTTK